MRTYSVADVTPPTQSPAASAAEIVRASPRPSLSETSVVHGMTGPMVTTAEPVAPSLVAVIVAFPGATPATSPLVTVAMFTSDVDQVTVRPVSALPEASRGVAESSDVVPGATRTVAGVTRTDATTARVTVSAA